MDSSTGFVYQNRETPAFTVSYISQGQPKALQRSECSAATVTRLRSGPGACWSSGEHFTLKNISETRYLIKTTHGSTSALRQLALTALDPPTSSESKPNANTNYSLPFPSLSAPMRPHSSLPNLKFLNHF